MKKYTNSKDLTGRSQKRKAILEYLILDHYKNQEQEAATISRKSFTQYKTSADSSATEPDGTNRNFQMTQNTQ
uniref:Uncharacterized protein n=1 Tax=Caenorhabditis japonica TaxID=281687 RepID=A0A8R1IGQ5_CAEJA